MATNAPARLWLPVLAVTVVVCLQALSVVWSRWFPWLPPLSSSPQAEAAALVHDGLARSSSDVPAQVAHDLDAAHSTPRALQDAWGHPVVLLPDDEVLIHDMTRRQDLNGKTGKVRAANM